MNALAVKFILLADRTTIFRDMGSGFREKRETFDPTDLLWWIFVAVLVVAAFGVVATILAKQDKRRFFNSPRALFRALSKTHELDRVSRKLLQDLARSQRLTTPAQLFLEPNRFEPAMIPVELRPRQSEIAALRQRLFAGL